MEYFFLPCNPPLLSLDLYHRSHRNISRHWRGTPQEEEPINIPYENQQWLKSRLVMGVGTHNFGVFVECREVMAALGIFGMSYAARYQLISKFRTCRFSFCIPIDKNKVGYVRFGNASELLGSPVKLVPSHFYLLGLTRISFNGRALGRDSWEGYDMMVDTGTPVSMINEDILDAIKEELEDLFDESSIGSKAYPVYWDSVSTFDEEVTKMTITLHFGHLDFMLSHPQIWQQKEEVSGDIVVPLYCLNMFRHVPTSLDRKRDQKRSLLGTFQMTNKNIGIFNPHS